MEWLRENTKFLSGEPISRLRIEFEIPEFESGVPNATLQYFL
jgi:hypothetical protein